MICEIVDPDIVVDNCAICRNHIMDLCEFFENFGLAKFHNTVFIRPYCEIISQASNVKLIKLVPLARSALLPGVRNFQKFLYYLWLIGNLILGDNELKPSQLEAAMLFPLWVFANFLVSLNWLFVSLYMLSFDVLIPYQYGFVYTSLCAL